MKKSVTKNFIYNLIYQVLAIILPLITTPYVSRVLGAENLGIYSYTLSIVTYFILFGSLGVALYGQREIAYVQDDKEKRSKVFYELLIFRIITLSISMLVFYFTFVFRNNDYNNYYFILLFEMIAAVLDISWFFQGMEDFKKTVSRNLIIKIISIICIFVFVKTKEDLPLYFVIYVLSNVIGNLSLWLYLPKFIKKIKFKSLNITKHIKPTLILFVPQIAVQVYTILDKTMIGTIITDKTETGFYDQSQKLIKMLLTIVTAMGTVMLPRIANNFAKKDFETIKRHIYKSFDLALLISLPIIAGICGCADIFVPKFFGEGYEKVSILMKIVSPIILFIGLSNVIGTQYLLPTKKQKQYTISVVLGAIINFGLNMWLIPQYGAIGASIGTVVAEFGVTLCQYICVRKEFKFIRVFKSFIRYGIYSIIMYLVCFGLSFIPLKDTYVLFIQAGGGVIVYALMLIILRDSLFIELKNKVTNLFKKKKLKEE